MKACSLGQGGILLEHGEVSVVIDPFLCSREEYQAVEAVDPRALTTRTEGRRLFIVVTHGDPTRFWPEGLPVGEATWIAPPHLLEHLCCRVGRRPARSVEMASWEWILQDGLRILPIASESGHAWSICVASDRGAAWVLGKAVHSTYTAERLVRELADFEPIAFVGGDLGHYLTVLRGGCRGFPFTPYSDNLQYLRGLIASGWRCIFLPDGLLFKGRAAWLDAFARPVGNEQLRMDLGAACAFAHAGQWLVIPELADSGHKPLPVLPRPRPSVFDPTQGIPEMQPEGAADPNVRFMLQSLLDRLVQQVWWLPHGLKWARSSPLFEVRERSNDGDRFFRIAIKSPEVIQVEEQSCPEARIRVACTAIGLGALLGGQETATELALRGHLRVAGGEGSRENSVGRRNSLTGKEPPDPLRLFDAVSPLARPLDWP